MVSLSIYSFDLLMFSGDLVKKGPYSYTKKSLSCKDNRINRVCRRGRVMTLINFKGLHCRSLSLSNLYSPFFFVRS